METRRKVFGAICSANVLLGGHGGLPSKHRIGSTTAANADQCGGIMLSSFLVRCLKRSFRTWHESAVPAANDDEENDDDFRKIVRKRLWRTLHSLTEQGIVDRLCTNWMAKDLDHCWMKIQHMDAAGNILQHIVHRDASPFVAACRGYTLMISQPLDAGALRGLMWHFDAQFQHGFLGLDDGVTLDSIIDKLRLLACGLNCQLVWRCVWATTKT